jgi:phospholipase/carboxylesterase
MKEVRVAELDCRVAGGTDGNGAGSGPLVILLHGFGAPGTDLLGLSRMLRAPEGTRFLFPEAPIDLSAAGPYPAGARAWWLLDLVAAQIAALTGDVQAFTRSLRPGLDAAKLVLSALLHEVVRTLEPDSERIVLGGFSQGAILSLETALSSELRLGGLLLFSASLLDAEEVRDRAASIAPMHAVVSHGRQDPILPFLLGEELARTLTSAGWQADWVPFDGGHGIAPEALASAEQLLLNRFAPPVLDSSP